MRKQHLGDADVIVNHLALGKSCFWIKDFVQIRNPESAYVESIFVCDETSRILGEIGIHNSSNNVNVDLRNFSSGTYFIRINSGDKVIIRRIVKM